LETAKRAHFNAQAPSNQLVFFGERADVQIHFNQPLDEVQRTIVFVWPQIVDLLTVLGNHWPERNALHWTAI
jgi:hypothetical protein